MPVTTFAKSMMSSWYVEILVVCADDCTGNNAIGITDLSDKELNTGISLRMDGTLNIQGVVTTDWTDEFSIDSSVFFVHGYAVQPCRLKPVVLPQRKATQTYDLDYNHC